MPVRIYTTNAGTDLSDAESALLADLIARHGRAVLLAPTFAELDLCVMMRRKPAFRWVSTTRRYIVASLALGAFGRRARFRRQPAAPDAVFGHGHALDDATCSRFRAARARCVCLRAWPAMCCRVWRGRVPNDAVATTASRSQKAMPRLVCSSFCVPTRAVWTVEIWSSPARRLTLWPVPWPIPAGVRPRRMRARYHVVYARSARAAVCRGEQWGRGRRAACPRAGGDARGACHGI